MKVVILGEDSPVARATRRVLQQAGHEITAQNADIAIYFPGSAGELRDIAARKYRRLVVRSHAVAYGPSTKNPGLMTEDRISLLPTGAREQRWIEIERVAAEHPNSASVRLTNILDAGERDLIVRKLSGRAATTVAGRDPNVQFISLDDAARSLMAAAASNATGVFNATGHGAIPLKKALRAAGIRRMPLFPGLLRPFHGGESIDQLQYNWTVSSDRAAAELNWRPEQSTAEALTGFLALKPGGHAGVLRNSYDDWGLDVDYIRAWGAWFWFLRNIYWRIDHEGMENVPDTGRALLVANHRGFIPIDAVMHLSLIFTLRHRIPRFLIIHSLLRLPFLCNFLTKLGGVVASQENAARLFRGENLVGIFPEGIRGAFTPYKHAYELRDFTKSGFARMAIENEAPIVPAVVVGHAEIFPILGRLNWSYLTREYGWPYLPIAPPFPLAPVPLPTKWHVRVLKPVPLEGLRSQDAVNPRVVKEFTRHIQALMQRNIDEMVQRRKHVFWGRILSGVAPEQEPFRLPMSQPMGRAQ
jgi:1-acyl-sn-glycerol-3-phosphate acyltransferase